MILSHNKGSLLARAPARPPSGRLVRPKVTNRSRPARFLSLRCSGPSVVASGTLGVEMDDASVDTKKTTARVAVFSTETYMKPFFQPAILGAFPKSKFIPAQLTVETASLAKGFDTVCLFVNDVCGKEVLEKLSEVGVKLIAMRCAGYDRVDVKAARELGIRVVRVPTYSPTSVAEHAVALLLALNRKVHLAYNRVWQGNYSLSGLEGEEIHGKTVGVIGTGAIGTCFCSIMKGFGCKVLAYDVKENPQCLELGVRYVDMDELLLKADIVSLHAPLVKSTFHIMNKERLVAMKPTGYLINVSRGGLVDTDALLDALENGDIGGCGMDVYENEGNLFFQDFTSHTPVNRLKYWDRRFAALKAFPNVVITPHSAFLTQEALQNIADTTVANIHAFSRGEELANEVRPL